MGSVLEKKDCRSYFHIKWPIIFVFDPIKRNEFEGWIVWCDIHISTLPQRTQPHQKFESNQLRNHLNANANLPEGNTHYLKIPPAHKLAWRYPPKRAKDMQWGGKRTHVNWAGWGCVGYFPPFSTFWVSEIWQTIMRLSFITNARQLYKLMEHGRHCRR